MLYLHPLPLGGRQVAGGPAAAQPRYPLLPMGVVGLCNLLQARGHRVRGLNLAVEWTVAPGIDLAARLAGGSPRLVLIDLHWHEHCLGALELAQSVRESLPGAFVLLGGLTASAYAVELLALCPAVDAVVRGDAEAALPALARALEQGQSDPPDGLPNLVTRREPEPARWVAGPSHLDALDVVSLGFLDHAEAYQRLIHSHPRRPGIRPAVGARGHWLPNGRGCAWDCGSCGGGRGAHRAVTGRPGLVWRDPAQVAADLAQLRDAGVQQVALGLDPDMAGAAHRDACLGSLGGLGLYLESFQLPSVALLDAVARGCDPDHSELAITAVSGDPAHRRRHGKAFGDGELLACLDVLRARGMSVSVFFALGLPGEDDAAFEATLALAGRLIERDRLGTQRVAALPQALDPGAPMALEPARWGLEPTDAGDLAARLARARGLADGSLHPLDPRALGYRVPGCELRDRAARWNELATQAPEAVIPVPGG